MLNSASSSSILILSLKIGTMAPSTRQPILFPVLEDIEFCSCKADLVTQHDGEVYVCNPDNSHCYIFYHRDLEPNKPIQAQVRPGLFSAYNFHPSGNR